MPCLQSDMPKTALAVSAHSAIFGLTPEKACVRPRRLSRPHVPAHFRKTRNVARVLSRLLSTHLTQKSLLSYTTWCKIPLCDLRQVRKQQRRGSCKEASDFSSARCHVAKLPAVSVRTRTMHIRQPDGARAASTDTWVRATRSGSHGKNTAPHFCPLPANLTHNDPRFHTRTLAPTLADARALAHSPCTRHTSQNTENIGHATSRNTATRDRELDPHAATLCPRYFGHSWPHFRRHM